MSGFRAEVPTARDAALRARNRRTGLILASIALVFFLGIFVKYGLMR